MSEVELRWKSCENHGYDQSFIGELPSILQDLDDERTKCDVITLCRCPVWDHGGIGQCLHPQPKYDQLLPCCIRYGRFEDGEGVRVMCTDIKTVLFGNSEPTRSSPITASFSDDDAQKSLCRPVCKSQPLCNISSGLPRPKTEVSHPAVTFPRCYCDISAPGHTGNHSDKTFWYYPLGFRLPVRGRAQSEHGHCLSRRASNIHSLTETFYVVICLHVAQAASPFLR